MCCTGTCTTGKLDKNHIDSHNVSSMCSLCGDMSEYIYIYIYIYIKVSSKNNNKPIAPG